MTVITCKKCGKEINEKASYCPNCGEPLTAELTQRKRQNQCLALLGGALLVAILGYLPVGENKKKQKPLLYVVVDALTGGGKKKKKKR